MFSNLHPRLSMLLLDLQSPLSGGVTQQGQTRAGGGARDGVGRKTMSMKQRVSAVLAQKALEDFLAHRCGAQRQKATSQPLRQTDDVWDDLGALAREQRPGSSKPGEHL